MDGVERIEQRTDTMTHWVTKIGGSHQGVRGGDHRADPDEHVAWSTVGGEVKQAGVVTFHRLDETKTKVMLQLDYDPDGFAENDGDKLSLVKRQITGDLKRFKTYTEDRVHETGSWGGEV